MNALTKFLGEKNPNFSLQKYEPMKLLKNSLKSFTSICEIRSISPYLVRMRKNTDQKKLRIWTLFTQCVVIRERKITCSSNGIIDISCKYKTRFLIQ